MAQKFSDWYYAVTTVRVADRSGREPLERACQAFAQGIISVTRPSALVDWAHDLLERELQTIGRGLDAGPSPGGDHANGITRNQSPTALIQAAASAVEPSHLQLLAHAFDKTTPIERLEKLGESLGGLPFALLDARYSLKRSLQASAEVPFAVVPDAADMDRAPISLYEAGRLASVEEVASLEKWLLTDIDLCKDVAEFAAFVHAMRDGALSAWAVETAPEPTPEPTPEPPAPAVPEPASTEQADAPPAEAQEDLLEDPDDLLEDPDDLLEDPDDLLEGPRGGDSSEAASEPAFEAPLEQAPAAPASRLTSALLIIGIILGTFALLMAATLWALRG